MPNAIGVLLVVIVITMAMSGCSRGVLHTSSIVEYEVTE